MSNGISLVATFAGLAGGIGIVLSGIAAHGSADPMLASGAQFLVLQAIAALAIAALAAALPPRRDIFLFSAALVLGGAFLFCSDLGARALLGSRLFPMAAPIGGGLTILGWATLTIAALLASVKARD
jgi:uncharacterized membrane protein YgdD (TMEM256/DUF423 family)